MKEEIDLMVLNIKRPDEALFKRSESALEIAREVEERPDLLPLVKIDQSALNAMTRVLKGELNLPGVKVSKEASIAARSH